MSLTNKEIMMEARNVLKGNWGTVIGTSVLFMVITIALSSIPKIGSLVNLILAGPLQVGLAIFYLALVRKNKPEIKNIFDGFSSFANNLAAYLLIILFTFLWMLLLIVPGIIAGLSYSMTMYILADNPNMDAMAAIKKSKAMMMGNKAKLFFLFCRFIGWIFVGILTIGIGFLWIWPYMMTSVTTFYEDLRETNGGTATVANNAAVS